MVFKVIFCLEGFMSWEVLKVCWVVMVIDLVLEFDVDVIELVILDVIFMKYMCIRGRCKRMSWVMMKMSIDGLNLMMWKISVFV